MDVLNLSAAAALDLVERLASIVVALTALEVLMTPAALAPGGVLDWRLLSLRAAASRSGRPVMGSVAGRLLNTPGVFGLAIVDLLGAATMALEPRLVIGPLVCFVMHVIFSKRHFLAVDGSDDMLIVLLGVSILRCLSPDDAVQVAGALFVAGQAALSYLTAGISKSQSIQWWSGSGLQGTLTTDAYGEPHIARFLVAHPAAARLLGPFTIAWECTAPLAILAGPGPTLAALGVAGGFHLFCAFVMGLPAFFWAFVATFPAIVFATGWIGTVVGPGERVVLVLAAALPLFGAVCYFGGSVAQEARWTRRQRAAVATPAEPVVAQV